MEKKESSRKNEYKEVQIQEKHYNNLENKETEQQEEKEELKEDDGKKNEGIEMIHVQLADVQVDAETLMTVQEDHPVKPLYSLQLQRTSSFRSLLGDESFYGVVKAKPYKLAIILQILVWAWFWINIILYLTDVYKFYVLIPLGLLYLLYLFESFTDKINSYLWNIERTLQFKSHLQQVQKEKPRITWKVESYHYQHQARPTKKPRSIITNHQQTQFYYSEWKDLSESVDEITRQGVVKVSFEIQVVCSSKKTQRMYSKKKREFILANKTDEKIKFEEEITLPSFKQYILAVKEKKRIPYWMHIGVYWFFTIIMFSWLYRQIFNYKSGNYAYTFLKEITREEDVIPEVTSTIKPKTSPKYI